MKLRLFLQGGIWWVAYSQRGVLWEEPTGTSDRRQAELFARRCLGQCAPMVPASEGEMTLETAKRAHLTDYQINNRKSSQRAIYAWKHLEAYFNLHAKLREITAERILSYVSYRLQNVRRGTVLYELRVLHHSLALLVQLGILDKLPRFPKIKNSDARQGFFEDAEFNAVCKHLTPDIVALVRFLYWTGWRLGEGRLLTWRQVDWKAQVVRLEPGTTKNDEGRIFPFGKLLPLKTLLGQQRDVCAALERQAEKVIPWVFFRPHTGKQIGDFRMVWRRACRDAGLPGKLIHDLRRTAVRRMERAGVPRRVAMQLTGHQTESVYQRYAIVNEADLIHGIEKLELHRLDNIARDSRGK